MWMLHGHDYLPCSLSLLSCVLHSDWSQTSVYAIAYRGGINRALALLRLVYIDSYCLLWDVIDTKFLVFPSFYGLVWLTHRPAGTVGDWKSMCVCINNAYHLQLSHIFNDAIIHLLYTVVEWIICSVNNRDNYGRRTMKWSLSINFNK